MTGREADGRRRWKVVNLGRNITLVCNIHLLKSTLDQLVIVV